MRRSKPRNAAEARRWVEARNNLRLARALEMGEAMRRERVLVELSVRRVGIDPTAVPIVIVDDGGHRRRVVTEGGEAWPRVWSRSALVKWFDQILKSAGV